jgi:hypothetical protein
MIFGAFIFVAINEVECLDQQMWFVESLLANNPGCEDYLLSMVDYRLVQELNIA